MSIIAIVKRAIIALYFLIDRRSLLVIEKELIPYFPPIFEWLYHVTGRKYVLDYDDAVWHNYDKCKKNFIKYMLSSKHPRILSWSSGVIAGSEYIYNFALSNKAPNIIKIPTVIDIDKYHIATPNKKEGVFVIGWIGSPSSSQYLKLVESALCKLTTKYNASVHLIGVDQTIADRLKFNKVVLPWSEDTESELLSNIDVGIMPLKDSAFERGKCSFKLIQYMAMGKPVICSPVGENKNVVVNEQNGYFASSDDEWFDALEKLILDKNLASTLGQISRQIIEDTYTLQIQQIRYLNFIEKINNG